MMLGYKGLSARELRIVLVLHLIENLRRVCTNQERSERKTKRM